MIYMKGHPDAPRCGFSALAVKVLQQYGVRITSRDIVSDLKLKDSVKAHINWPTFRQIFIKGDFVGGSDIILNMHQVNLKICLVILGKRLSNMLPHETNHSNYFHQCKFHCSMMFFLCCYFC